MKHKHGIIVGRFQVPYLHAGHLYLIGTALQECEEVHIILGTTEGEVKNEKNPYTFFERTDIISIVFPAVSFYDIEDCESNEEWSQKLDTRVAEMLGGIPENTVVYHSRDSFKETYSGNLTLKELPEIPGFSGTALRNSLKS